MTKRETRPRVSWVWTESDAQTGKGASGSGQQFLQLSLFLPSAFFFNLFGCFGSWLQHLDLLGVQASLAVVRASLQLWHAGSRAHRLSGCRGLCFPAACGILVPQPGMEPVSPALEGRVLTTGPPGRS